MARWVYSASSPNKVCTEFIEEKVAAVKRVKSSFEKN